LGTKEVISIIENMKNEVDHYLENFPEDIRTKLEDLRWLIRSLIPEATEIISYGMPTYRLNKNLVHFAGYKNHIGFYPAPSAILHFKEELKMYKTSKGAIQFFHKNELPMDLITEIINFRIIEDKQYD
jgi:uncharacterized protein YdhG (YjbR/CyaY superfamily)